MSRQEVTPQDKIEIWKTAIDTQKHFNDICVRTRQFGFGFVVAALGLAIVLINQFPDSFIETLSLSIHVSVFVVFAAILALFGVWNLDLGVYHKTLRGAVKFVEEYEKSYFAGEVIGMPNGLTEYISAYSRYDEVKIDEATRKIVTGAGQKLAGVKIRQFYIFCVSSLVVIVLVIAVVVKPTS